MFTVICIVWSQWNRFFIITNWNWKLVALFRFLCLVLSLLNMKTSKPSVWPLYNKNPYHLCFIWHSHRICTKTKSLFKCVILKHKTYLSSLCLFFRSFDRIWTFFFVCFYFPFDVIVLLNGCLFPLETTDLRCFKIYFPFCCFCFWFFFLLECIEREFVMVFFPSYFSHWFKTIKSMIVYLRLNQ